jgi:hypothetical protein
LARSFLKTGRGFSAAKSPKKFLVLNPGEKDFSTSENMHDRRKAPRMKLFILLIRSQQEISQPQKKVCVLVPVNVFRTEKLMMLEEHI